MRVRLLAWYKDAQRDLPWRSDRDPYHILVSEMMLVQTTVAAVIPYYSRFLTRFPTVAALAAASESEVIKAWEGLGYYRRARQLHAAAKVVVQEHGGSIPNDPEAIRSLPGVGRYIAGALLSFAFDRPAPIVEANTQRVLARWLALREDLRETNTRARLWSAAERLVPEIGAGTFNQAFMELGALLCTPRAPSCLVCPVSSDCRARGLGLQDSLPVRTPRPSPLAAVEACALVTWNGRLLIVERGVGKLWEGFWEFPTIHVSGADPAGRSLAGPALDLTEGILRQTGAHAEVGPVVYTIHYGVTRHRVRLDAHEAHATSSQLKPGPGLRQAIWESPENLLNYPFSAASRRLIAWAARKAARDSSG
ncbi:MAG: A/G-specific adenine glycosylase [Isosphaeraceae bacterium]